MTDLYRKHEPIPGVMIWLADSWDSAVLQTYAGRSALGTTSSLMVACLRCLDWREHLRTGDEADTCYVEGC